MDFYEVLDQVVNLLQRRGRATYNALKLQFNLDDDQLATLKEELLYSQPQVTEDEGRGLIWTGKSGAATPLVLKQEREPVSYTPQHLAEKILASRSSLQGERKQVTVMFADIKDSIDVDSGIEELLCGFRIEVKWQAGRHEDGSDPVAGRKGLPQLRASSVNTRFPLARHISFCSGGTLWSRTTKGSYCYAR